MREKGVWPKKSKKIMPKLGEPELHVPHEQCLTVCFLFLFFYFVLTPPSSRSHCTLSTLRYTRRHLPSDVPWISQAAPITQPSSVQRTRMAKMATGYVAMVLALLFCVSSAKQPKYPVILSEYRLHVH